MSPTQTLERVFLDCLDIETDLRRLVAEELDPTRKRELALVAERMRSVGELAVERGS